MSISPRLASCSSHLKYRNRPFYLAAAVAIAAVMLPLIGALDLRPISASEAAPATSTSRLALPALEGQKAIDHLKQQGLYDSLGEAMRAARYSFNPVERPEKLGVAPGSHYANNPTQQYQAIFTPDDVQIVPGGGAKEWQAGMRLAGYGYGHRIRPAGKAEMKATTTRVEYHRQAANGLAAGIVEWYVNRAEGVEQGFTLAAPPMEKREGEPLVVALDLTGNLRAKVNAEGQAVTLSKRGGASVLRYEKLVAMDATGRELGARMRVEGERVMLEVDDAGALYPVVIDPTFSQQQKLTASDAGASDFFGSAVAIDGETVIVGSPFDDNAAGSNAGSAYIFVRTCAECEITCPANVIAVAAPSCPPATGTVVTFADPQTSDDCVMASIMCSPPSGSSFPVGTTTVTCMASDAAGNKSMCSFTVTVFNGCLQDDTNQGNQVLFNTFTGEYIFCCNGAVVATGTGTLTKQGCVYTIQHNTSTRRVLIKVDFTVKRGNASIQMPPGSLKCTITDRDIRDNQCNCGAVAPR